MDYSSIFKPRGANVRSLVLQNSSVLSGSDGPVLSIKVFQHYSKDHYDLHLKNDHVNISLGPLKINF